MNSELYITPKKILVNTPRSRLICNIDNGLNVTPKCLLNGGITNSFTPTRIFNKKNGTFHLLPVINTPPTRFPKVVNPFEASLAERLHLPLICSPLFCQTLTPNSKNNTAAQFEWTIDEISSLSSVNVEPCETQFQETPDPDVEAKAQEAISVYFKEQNVVPSPMDCQIRKNKFDLTDICINKNTYDFVCDSTRKTKTTCDGTTQTILTLPPILPKNVENVLKEFLTYNVDQQQTHELDNEAIIDYEARDASLRRKLFEYSHSSINSCDTEDFNADLNCLSPPPRSPDIVAHPGATKRFNDSNHYNECRSSSMTQRNSSFDAISPISKNRTPSNKEITKVESNCSIDIFSAQSTPERFPRSFASYMEIANNSKCLYNGSVDDMQISQINLQHPTTPLRSFNRSANRKNLSQSFILYSENEIGIRLETMEKENIQMEFNSNETTSMLLQKTDSGFNESTNVNNIMLIHNNLDSNYFGQDVSMRSDVSGYILSSTPSKTVE